MRLLKELTSRFNAFGIDLVNGKFITKTMKFCAKEFAREYQELLKLEGIDGAAAQIFADVSFLDMVLINESEFKGVIDIFEKKVYV